MRIAAYSDRLLEDLGCCWTGRTGQDSGSRLAAASSQQQPAAANGQPFARLTLCRSRIQPQVSTSVSGFHHTRRLFGATMVLSPNIR